MCTAFISSYFFLRASSTQNKAIDVATLALSYDVDQLYEKGRLIPTDWQKRLNHNSSPYTSTIVFLVRKGNPKKIKDYANMSEEQIGKLHGMVEKLLELWEHFNMR